MRISHGSFERGSVYPDVFICEARADFRTGRHQTPVTHRQRARGVRGYTNPQVIRRGNPRPRRPEHRTSYGPPREPGQPLFYLKRCVETDFLGREVQLLRYVRA